MSTPEQIVRAHQYLYYVLGRPVLTDYEYDMLCRKHGIEGGGGSDLESDYTPRGNRLRKKPSESVFPMSTLKTLVVYSGQTRSIAQVWPNHLWFLYRQLPKPVTVIASVADDAQADDMHRLFGHFGDPQVGVEAWHMEKVKQPDDGEILKVLAHRTTTPHHSGYPPSSSPGDILRQFWALNRAWEFAKEKVNVADYGLVIRVRPDSSFLRLEMPWPRGRSTDQWVMPEIFCFTPRWARWGGCNDRFALLGKTAAEAYFTTYQRIPELLSQWHPLHPETLLMSSLRMRGIEPDDALIAEFKTVRTDGSIAPCDYTTIDVVDAIINSRR